MVHILAPQPPHVHLPILFNVDAAVGQNAPAGAPNDVMLVQFFLKLIGDNPGGLGAAHTATFKKVVPTGKMDQATIDGIKAAQASSSATQDGRVQGDGLQVRRHLVHDRQPQLQHPEPLPGHLAEPGQDRGLPAAARPCGAAGAGRQLTVIIRTPMKPGRGEFPPPRSCSSLTGTSGRDVNGE